MSAKTKTTSSFAVRIGDYVRQHKGIVISLTVVAITALAVGRWWFRPGSIEQGLSFSFGAGVLSSLLIAVVTDFMSKQFFYDVLRNFETSVHEGSLVRATHRDILSRPDTVEKYFTSGQTAKIITMTAGDYVDDEAVLEIVKKGLKAGAKLRILLHTPIYTLRSYVDQTRNEPAHGKLHVSALELVRKQTSMFDAIEDLCQQFGEAFQVKFFPAQLHMRCAIWGKQRLFAAPVLRGVNGLDSPCIEVFPGILGSDLYSKFENDFDYIWDRADLTFSIDALKPLYGQILGKYPLAVDRQGIDPSFVAKIEADAEAIQRSASV